MPIAALTPQYDIIPHGVSKIGSIMYMKFKIIVTFKEFEKSGDIDDKIWNNTAELINKVQWGYNINSSTINFKEYEETEGDQPIFFNFDSTKTSSFCFGERKPGNSVFQFLKNGFTIGNPQKDAILISQMEEISVDKDNFTTHIKGDYTQTLKNALNYDENEKSIFTSPRPSLKDFTAVYASILDDYEVAEKGFGVVRTFLIPIQKISDTADAESLINNLYKIRVMEHMGQALYFLEKKEVNSIDKYYNGLSEKYFVTRDFLSAEVMKYDPYKENLASDPDNVNKTELHPDGAYMVILYHEDQAKNIKDPFDREGVKGFNVVVNQNGFHSLSYHKVSVQLKGRMSQVFDSIDSSAFSPRTSLLVKDNGVDKGKRSNLLFAWRGDNLIINRLSPTIEESYKEAVHFDNLKNEEANYVKSYLFEKDYQLLPGSQIQLNVDKIYQFFIRKVSVSGHYIPLQSEIAHLSADVQAYTLTFQDDVISTARLGNDFIINPVEIPIKAATIIGTKIYKKQQIEFVDQAQQMVLDLTKETRERRFIYPPQIKFEDLKFLSYLTREKLRKSLDEKPTRTQLARRCLDLEKKIDRKPRTSADEMHPVPYLVDPRGTNVFIAGTDFFTAAKLEAKSKSVFKIDAFYPFFDKTQSVELLLEKKGDESNFKIFPNGTKSELLWKSIKKGIYNLSVYITDKEITEGNIDQYTSIPFKISVLGLPDKPFVVNEPLFEKEKEITRNTLFPNYWFKKIKHTSTSDGWKSLKYLEKSKVLKLQHGKNLNDILENYYEQEKVKRMELFNDEYPYEMFLTDEGGFKEENGLKTSIYPNNIKIGCNANSLETGKFFTWKLNDQETLTVTINTTKKVVFSVGEKSLITDNGTIKILFDLTLNQYVIKNDVSTTGIILKKYLYQDLSIKDIKVNDSIFNKIRLNNRNLIKVDDINSFIFIDDNKNPYHQKKEILFYSSSMFQAYYPNIDSEFTLGTMADQSITIEIPNNVKPETPLVKYEKLIKNTTNKSWKTDAKEGRTESLVRLILQPDFMKEGKNKLGIVLAGTPINNIKNPNVSRVGEDITKLTDVPNLLNMEIVINNREKSQLLSKYISKEAIKHYSIDETLYWVLECIPFYNTKTREWQVVLSFDLKQTETMFIKLVTLKIAEGHGLEKERNSLFDVFVDTSGTNLSSFSSPCEFPIYSHKRIVIKKTSNELGLLFNIYIESVSKYKEKVYFIMLLKPNASKDVFNFDSNSQIEKFPSLVPFSYYTPTPSTMSSPGRILQVNGVPNVVISREICESVIVLEFELHQNHNLKLDKAIDFVQLNPLFENKGIRLTNAVEFKY